MILGMSIETFTVVHVGLSLVGIVSGLLVLVGMFRSQRQAGWTALFLLTTILTSAGGFFFPAATFGPPQLIGVLSLVVLAVAVMARYVGRLAGAARWIYVATAVFALYLNVFVGIAQAFQNLSFLQPLAPTQSEPPFLYTQLAVLAVFVVLAIVALIRFRPAPPEPPIGDSIRRAGL